MDIAILILQIVVIITVVAVRFYIPTYLGEKGKNLATKEDIAGITRIVESTKSEYIKELEILRETIDLYYNV